MNNNRIQNRLKQLRQEYEKGEAMLADLDQQRQALQEQLLRIAGAIEVLSEFEHTPPPPPPVTISGPSAPS